MRVRYNLEALPSLASVRKGVAAFDPVTLKIAVEKVAKVGISMRARPELDASCPSKLTELADISVVFERGSFRTATVTINTGHMTWDVKSTPKRGSLQDYRGRQIEAVGLSCHPLIEVDGRPLTRVRMLTPAGHPVWVWFTELATEVEQVDGWELLELAQASMEAWEAQKSTEHSTAIGVPVLDMKYEALVGGVVGAGPVSQRFLAEMDETGAHVVAVTVIPSGMPVNFTLPPRYDFGAQGPVCLWFSEEGAELPFSIIYTSSEAWEETDPDGL